jgi:hypothetical protein
MLDRSAVMEATVAPAVTELMCPNPISQPGL